MSDNKILIDSIEYFQQFNELDELGGCDNKDHTDFMACEDCRFEMDGECTANVADPIRI